MEATGMPQRVFNSGQLEIVHVLLLLQAAVGLVAGLGLMMLMRGNPAAVPAAFGKPALLFILAAGIARGWKWARKTTLVVETFTLLGLAASALVGLTAQLDSSINLVTLLTNVAIPVGVIALLRAGPLRGHDGASR